MPNKKRQTAMLGIFLLDSQRLAPPLDGRPIVLHWLANGPILHQLVHNWTGLIDRAELWIAGDQQALLDAWLKRYPPALPVETVAIEESVALSAERLAARLPEGMPFMMALDHAIVMPGSFQPQSGERSVGIGETALWLASTADLTRGNTQPAASWPEWVEKISPDRIFRPDQAVSLLGDGSNNEALFAANRRLLAIGHSSGTALERSYVEEFTVIPPVYIDPEAEIYTSVIGPYTAVGPGALVENGVLRHTVIDREAQVRDVLLEMSYIGPNQQVNGQFSQIQKPSRGDVA